MDFARPITLLHYIFKTVTLPKGAHFLKMQCHTNSRILCKKHWCSCHLVKFKWVMASCSTHKEAALSTDMMSAPTSKIPTVYSRNANDNVTKPSCS